MIPSSLSSALICPTHHTWHRARAQGHQCCSPPPPPPPMPVGDHNVCGPAVAKSGIEPPPPPRCPSTLSRCHCHSGYALSPYRRRIVLISNKWRPNRAWDTTAGGALRLVRPRFAQGCHMGCQSRVFVSCFYIFPPTPASDRNLIVGQESLFH
jgi:hypothetical protein